MTNGIGDDGVGGERQQLLLGASTTSSTTSSSSTPTTMRDDDEQPTTTTTSGVPQCVPSHAFYPNCIVWCPLPLLTWLLPCVGHLGVTDAAGRIHDFVGPYSINVSRRRLGFGPPVRYYPLRADDFASSSSSSMLCVGGVWDGAVDDADARFRTQMHNLLCNNCHSHVAHALNATHFRARANWNTALLIAFMAVHGRFVPRPALLACTYVPFVLLVAVVVFLAVGVPQLTGH